jgi:DNA-binding CsgD family transcriptional regulator
MRELPLPSRAALEIVAMAEPINLELLLALTDAEALADLQQRSMVVVERLGEGEHVRGIHPVYGATIRGMLPATRRAEVAARLAGALIERGLAHHGEALRAALWLEAAGMPLPADLATRAATDALARSDAPLAERLAGATAGGDESVARLIALGTALSVQHKSGARQVLDRAIELASTKEERVEAVLACHRHLAFHGDHPVEGASLLRQLIPDVGEAAGRSELEAELAFYARAGGDAVNAVRLTNDLLDNPEADNRAVVSALVQSTRARITLGRFDGVEADLDRGEALALAMRHERPLAYEYLRCNRAIYLMCVDADAARHFSNAEYDRSLQSGGPSGVWALTQAHAYLSIGDLDAAFGHAVRSVTELAQFDPFFNLPSAYAVAALVSAQRRRFDEAWTWLSRLQGPRVRGWVWAERARLWLDAEQDASAAHARAFSAAGEAESMHIIAWGAAQLYHDLVRLGSASAAAAPLTRIAASTTSPLIAAMARHARAAENRDGEELASVAEDFAERGMLLLAAEALAQAAGCDGAPASLRDRWLARAAHLKASCPGATTPLVSGMESPLSDREAEIASLAAAGATSRQIAERLVLSVRTVDNHLAAVYRRLGLSGRDGLAAVFVRADSK